MIKFLALLFFTVICWPIYVTLLMMEDFNADEKTTTAIAIIFESCYIAGILLLGVL